VEARNEMNWTVFTNFLGFQPYPSYFRFPWLFSDDLLAILGLRSHGANWFYAYFGVRFCIRGDTTMTDGLRYLLLCLWIGFHCKIDAQSLLRSFRRIRF
jgi:hypothetical protein